MLIINTKLPKLCHAKPGDCIRLLDSQGEPQEPLYLVCMVPVANRRAARPHMPHGLYDDQRPLFLANLDNGEAIAMPHLSSRVEIVRDVAVVEGYAPDQATAKAA